MVIKQGTRVSEPAFNITYYM